MYSRNIQLFIDRHPLAPLGAETPDPAAREHLDGAMLVKSWSLLRWLLEEHAEDARRFLALRAEGLPSDQALSRATGLRVDDVDELWRRHVRATEGE